MNLPGGKGTTFDEKKAEHPCGCGDGRNLIVCIDGTSNQFGDNVSFVCALSKYSRFHLDPGRIPMSSNYTVSSIKQKPQSNRHGTTVVLALLLSRPTKRWTTLSGRLSKCTIWHLLGELAVTMPCHSATWTDDF
jgi:hypothetical protein